MRVPILAGNWKMHMTSKEALDFINELKPLVADTGVDVVICPPYTLLALLSEATKGSNIKIGAQNVHFEDKGAFTGEIAPGMLTDLGIDYCIIGHSERRQYYNETDETVNKKIKAAQAHGLTPIVCVGETLEDRKSGVMEQLLKEQITKGLEGVSAEDVKKLVIAYEPIWAIGTGETATADVANQAVAYIRSVIADLYGEEISEEVRIQYGGSVKPNNVTELMNQEDIDGALVGGASLVADSFSSIVNF